MRQLLRSSVIFGFDSAWTDQPKAPGAICAVGWDSLGCPSFHPPRLASFAQAQGFIAEARKGHDLVLVALDQLTLVPNATGMRPVDRLAGSLVSYIGGGVKPANRGKTGMFCHSAPIWRPRRCAGPDSRPQGDRGPVPDRGLSGAGASLA